MKTIAKRFCLLVTLFAAVSAFSQQESFMDEPGIPSFTTSLPVEHGFINLANGNLHIEIPIATYPQRGNIRALHARLVYDSRFWITQTDQITGALSWAPNGGPVLNQHALALGWNLVTDGETGNASNSSTSKHCTCVKVDLQGRCIQWTFSTTYSGYFYQEPNGTKHRAAQSFKLIKNDSSGCGASSNGNTSFYAVDNSGFKIVITNYTISNVYAPDGTQVFPSVQDTNGNQYSVDANFNVIDTLGRVPITRSSSGSQVYLDYLCVPQSDVLCDPNKGNRARVVLNTAPISLSTQFNQTRPSNVAEYSSSSWSAIQSIVFPDGSSYSFSYDSYGQITAITLPTGGQVTYGYGNVTDYQGNVNRWVTSRIADGQTWSISPAELACSTTPCTQQVTVTTPAYNDGTSTISDSHLYTFSLVNQGSASGAWNTEIQVFRGSPSGAAVLTRTTDYGAVSSCPATAGLLGFVPVPIRDTLTWPSGSGTLTKKAEYCYDSYANRTALKMWDYQPGGNFGATPDRENDTVFKTDSSYIGANILRLPQTVTALGPGGVQMAQSNYGYDEYSAPHPGLAVSGITTQHVTPTTPRGNPTSISRWLNTSTSPVVSQTAFYDTGEVYESIDPLSHTTTEYYDSTGAYPSQSCNALNQCSYTAYDFNTGLLTSSTDANNNSTTYAYDSMLRALCTNYPDGGQTCLSYPSSTSINQTRKITSAFTDSSSTLLDGLGRTSQTQHSTPAGVAKVDTAYDPIGRVFSVSNPYFFTSDATYGVVQTLYDALSRPVKTTKQDGSVSTVSYSANCVTVTDEAGKARKSCTNGFGQLTNVWEDPAGLNYETDYQYDGLDDLLRADQKGSAPGDSTQWRTRTFSYDSLKRLLTANNPESGTTTYTYDNDGNVLTKTDARGATMTITYAYDPLHRLTSKAYSNGAPNATYAYDQTTVWGGTVSNPIGHLTFSTGGYTGGADFSYDAMGRVIFEGQCMITNCYNIYASYDLAGDLTHLYYPSTRYLNFAYNSAGQLDLVQFAGYFPDSTVNYNYWSANDSNFLANGTPTLVSFGSGVNESTTLNKRLQLQQETVTNSTIGTLSDHVYGYGTQNNGNVLSIADQLSSAYTQNFSYDSLNRLHTANESRWGMSYVYDAWGNYLQQNQTGGTTYQHQYTVAANNRLNGYSYDSAGNTLNDGFHQYAYDAEERIINVDPNLTPVGASYFYDAFGNRVHKDAQGTSTDYLYFGGQIIGEYDITHQLWSEYIYANGKRVARANNFEHQLHISGTICSNCGWQWYQFNFSNLGAAGGHLIQAGDSLRWLQFNNTGSVGGIIMTFTDGTESWYSGQVIYDQNGERIGDGSLPINQWDYRVANLAPVVGKTISQLRLYADGTTTPGQWNIFYQDVVFMFADGTVVPLFSQSPAVPGLSGFGASGMTNTSATINDCVGSGCAPINTTTFYHGDQIGSSRLITDGNGYPIWQATFLPYGEEYNALSMATNHFKFSGKERDSESGAPGNGLDYFGARYYSNALGRFLSADPIIITGLRMHTPQMLNLYEYAGDDPASLIDPDGLDAIPATLVNQIVSFNDLIVPQTQARALNDPASRAADPEGYGFYDITVLGQWSVSAQNIMDSLQAWSDTASADEIAQAVGVIQKGIEQDTDAIVRDSTEKGKKAGDWGVKAGKFLGIVKNNAHAVETLNKWIGVAVNVWEQRYHAFGMPNRSELGNRAISFLNSRIYYVDGKVFKVPNGACPNGDCGKKKRTEPPKLIPRHKKQIAS